jgi:predicted phosphodiesterase
MTEVLDRIVEMRSQGLSFSRIATMLTMEGVPTTKDAVQKMVQRHSGLEPARRKVVALGDVHGRPNAELVDVIIAEQPDIIVVGGDVLDAAMLSKHGRQINEKRTVLRDEFEAGRSFLTRLSQETHADIKVIRGNHDDRAYRVMSDLLQNDWAYQIISETLKIDIIAKLGDLLAAVTHDIPRVELVSTALETHWPDGSKHAIAESPYLYVVGDAIVSHMNFCGKRAGAAVQKFYNWFQDWKIPLRLEHLRVFIQFHGHKAAVLPVEGARVTLVEPGMVADPGAESYKLGYQGYWSPGVVSACVFEQEYVAQRWQTNLSSVRLVFPW